MSEIRSESVKFSKKDIAVRIVCVLLIILFVLFVLYVVNTWNRVNSAKVKVDELCNSVFVSNKMDLILSGKMDSLDMYIDGQRYCYGIKMYEDNVITYIDDKGKDRYILILSKDMVYVEVYNEVCEREKQDSEY